MFDYDAYFNTPEKKAADTKFLKAYRAEEDAKAKKIRDEFNARVALIKAANAELKAANDAAEAKEYIRMYETSKALYLAKGLDEALAHQIACSDCQYVENQRKGYSND